MKHIGTIPFETQRLICRRFEMKDAADMLNNWAADPGTQLEYGEPVYEDIDRVNELLSGYISSYSDPSFYRWAIIEKQSGQNIGQTAFCRVYSDCRTAEIEYCIGKNFRGNGYAGEVLSGLIAHTFDNSDFERLEAYHRSENFRSGRVLLKSDMHITDTVERFIRENISPVGEVCYRIGKEEYLALKQKH